MTLPLGPQPQTLANLAQRMGVSRREVENAVLTERLSGPVEQSRWVA